MDKSSRNIVSYFSILSLVCLEFLGCSNQTADESQVAKNAMRLISESRELDEMYKPNVEHYFSNFGGSNGVYWISQAIIHDHYTLTMSVPISVDYSTGEVTLKGVPEFVLDEPTFSEFKDGIPYSRDANVLAEFGVNEWEEILREGDYTPVGVEIGNSQETDGLEEYYDQRRRRYRTFRF